MIYLDSAATTLEKPASVPRAVAAAIKECASPGRGNYHASGKANEIMYRCRVLASELFDVSDPERVVLTQNATHGLNIAIHTLVKPGTKVVISGYEHNAVTRALNSIPDVQICVAKGSLFNPLESLRSFETEISDNADVVICNHVSNVFGNIQPMQEIAELCRTSGKPLIIDASQSAGMIQISLKELGAAFIAMPGHKGLYGPQGTGLLICNHDVNPLIFGGTGSSSISQAMPDFLPDRLESGTQNVCGAAGLLAGMSFVRRVGIRNIGGHESNLSHYMAQLLMMHDKVHVFSGEHQSGVISFTVKDVDCETVGDLLSKRGIAVRAGLHCAPLAHKTAGTLEYGTVRISFSAFSTKKQAEIAAQEIWKIASKKGVR